RAPTMSSQTRFARDERKRPQRRCSSLPGSPAPPYAPLLTSPVDGAGYTRGLPEGRSARPIVRRRHARAPRSEATTMSMEPTEHRQARMSSALRYDVIVIGGGHAGIEASVAAARLGAKTALVLPNPDKIGLMPCNPAIGGPGKSQLVYELHALGGVMGRLADATAIHTRTLNA